MYDYEDEEEDIFGTPPAVSSSVPSIDFEKELNQDQFSAVTAPDCPALVLAGAIESRRALLTIESVFYVFWSRGLRCKS